MKFRIDKIPKTDKDLEEIQREVEQEHHHEHHHHHHEEVDLDSLIGELYASYEALKSKVDKVEKDDNKCKEEISRIYKILSRMLIALTTSDQNEKIKNLKEILSMLE